MAGIMVLCATRRQRQGEQARNLQRGSIGATTKESGQGIETSLDAHIYLASQNRTHV